MKTLNIEELFLKSDNIQLTNLQSNNHTLQEEECHIGNFTFLIDADFIYLDGCIEVMHDFNIKLFFDINTKYGSLFEEIELDNDIIQDLEKLLVGKLTF